MLTIPFVLRERFSVIIASFWHAMSFSSRTSFLLYLNGHEDESAYKDIRREKTEKKKEK